MIANPSVNHRLPRWNYPLLLAALGVLLCVLTLAINTIFKPTPFLPHQLDRNLVLTPFSEFPLTPASDLVGTPFTEIALPSGVLTEFHAMPLSPSDWAQIARAIRDAQSCRIEIENAMRVEADPDAKDVAITGKDIGVG